MFRYERPQKGRLRQFHQIGVELLGASEPMGDVEVMALGQHVLDEIGMAEHVTLELNTLGDKEGRPAYRGALVAYLEGHKDSLSADSLTGWSAIPCASWTARTRATGPCSPMRRRSTSA